MDEFWTQANPPGSTTIDSTELSDFIGRYKEDASPGSSILLISLNTILSTLGPQKGTDVIQTIPLLEIIALPAVQSFPRLLFHNVILFINTLTIPGTREVIG